jgi:hypothetical protein
VEREAETTKRGFNGQFEGLFGGACRDRTGDLRNAIAALSQLS